MTLPVDLLSGNVIDYYAKPNTGARIGEAIGKGAARFGDIVGQGIQRERERAFMQQQERSRLAEQKALAKYKFDLDKEGRDLRQRLAKEDAAAKAEERKTKRRQSQQKQLEKALTGYIANMVTTEQAAYGVDEQGKRKEVFIKSSELTRDIDDIAKALAGSFSLEDLQNMSRPQWEDLQEKILRPKIKKLLDYRDEEGRRRDLRERQRIKAMEAARTEKAAAKTDRDLLSRAARRIRGSLDYIGKLKAAMLLKDKSERTDKLINVMGTQTVSSKHLKNKAFEAVLVASSARPLDYGRSVAKDLGTQTSLKENRRLGFNLPIDNAGNLYHFKIHDPDQLAEEADKKSFYRALARKVYQAVQIANSAAENSKDPAAKNFGSQKAGDFLSLIGLPGVSMNLPYNQTIDEFLNLYSTLALRPTKSEQ